MFRIDTTTAAGTLPTPSSAGTPGFFTNGNPALGVPATVVDQDWFNRIQEEMMSLLTSSSITPVKSNYTQVMQAILSAGLIFDAGVVNALVANPNVPLTSLVVGTHLTLVPLNTNTGTSTINVSSLGALAVLRPDGSVVQPGDLKANQRIPIIYDGSAWRLVNWPTRVRLGANLTLFCNPQTGNDSNNGLTLGTAFASLQGVWNYLYQNVDVTGYVVTIQCSGTFTAGLNAQTVVVGSTPQSVVFNFQSGATISVTNGSCFQAFNPGVGYTVTGPVVISATGTGSGQGIGAVAGAAAQILIGTVNFGACAVAQIQVQYEGQINIVGNYTVSGSAPNSILAIGGQLISIGWTVTFVGTPAFSAQYVSAAWSGGHVVLLNMTYSGTATGTRYLANAAGTINTGGNLATLPGNAAGSATNNGYAN